MGHFQQTFHVVQRDGNTWAVARPQDQAKATAHLDRLKAGPPECFQKGAIEMLFEQPHKFMGLYAKGAPSTRAFVVDPTTGEVTDVVKTGDSLITYEKYLAGTYAEMTWL